MLLNDAAKRIERLAHVRVLRAKENPCLDSGADHRVTSLSAGDDLMQSAPVHACKYPDDTGVQVDFCYGSTFHC